MAFIQANDGTSLYYTDAGTGTPIVLIHGWPLSSQSWAPQSGFLIEHGYRVIAYDRRGFGQSGKPVGGYDYDTLAGDLNAIMTSLDLNHAVLIGFSMGGGEVARYLGTYGAARVARAVLISAVTPYLLKTEDNPEGVDHKVFDGMIAGIDKDRKHFMETFSHGFYGSTFFHHTASKADLDSFVAQAMMATPEATKACVRSFSATDFRNDLLKFTVPTLLIHGCDDATVPIGASATRAKVMIPKAQLIEYDGQFHGLTLTARDKVNADLIEFLGHPDKVAAI